MPPTAKLEQFFLCVLSMSFLMQFWAKKWSKLREKWGNFFEIFRDKTQYGGTGSGQESGDGGRLGRQAKFSPPGEDPQFHSLEKKTLWRRVKLHQFFFVCVCFSSWAKKLLVAFDTFFSWIYIVMHLWCFPVNIWKWHQLIIYAIWVWTIHRSTITYPPYIHGRCQGKSFVGVKEHQGSGGSTS